MTFRLIEALREITKLWATTVLLVEQNISEAVAVSDRLVAVAHGRCLELDEPPESVLSSSRLEEVFFGKTLR